MRTPPLVSNQSSIRPSWTEAPDELMLLIFGELDFASALTASRVCKCWHGLLQDNNLWMQFLRRDFELVVSKYHCSNGSGVIEYQKIYRDRHLTHNFRCGVYAGACFLTKFQCELQERGIQSFSKIDEKIFFGNFKGYLRICDLEGRCLQDLKGHEGHIRSLLHINGKIVTGGYDSKVRIWDKNGQCLQALDGHAAGIYHLLAVDGKIVSGSSDGAVMIWDMEEGKCLHVLQGYRGKITSLFSVDGKIVTGTDRCIKIWNMEGECVSEFKEKSSSIISVLGIDKKIVSSHRDGKIRIWNLEGKCLHVLEGDPIWAIHSLLAIDGKIVSGSPSKVRIWDLEGNLLRDFPPFVTQRTFISSSNIISLKAIDDTMFISSSFDWICRIWDTEGNCLSSVQMEEQMEKQSDFLSLALIDGRLFHSYSDGMVNIFDFRPSPHSLKLLKENLVILKKMADFEQTDRETIGELQETLHPDFKRLLTEFGIVPSESLLSINAILHVQAVIHIELLMHGISNRDAQKIRENLDELARIKNTDKLWELLWRNYGSPDVGPSLQSFILSGEEIAQVIAEISVNKGQNPMDLDSENAGMNPSQSLDSLNAEMSGNDFFHQEFVREWAEIAFYTRLGSSAFAKQKILALQAFRASPEFFAAKEDS